MSAPLDLEPVERGISRLRTRFGDALIFLTVVAGLLLLLISVSAAGLLVARMAARRPEIAMRLALGASRSRVLLDVLSENIVLALLAAGVTLVLSWASIPLIHLALPPYRNREGTLLELNLNLTPDFHVFAAGLAALAVVLLVCVLLPAYECFQVRSDAIVRSAASRRTSSARHAVLALEAALCTSLLLCAGLLWQTFRKLNSLDPEFGVSGVVTFSLDYNAIGYTGAQARALSTRLIDRIHELPGVRYAGFAQMGLMRGTGLKSTFLPAGQTGTAEDLLNSSVNTISEEYFDVLGMRFVAGRNFTRLDEGRENPVPAVVNEAFARRFFSTANPVGRRFGRTSPGVVAQAQFEIVGVTNNVKYRSLREPDEPIVYELWNPHPNWIGPQILHVQTQDHPSRLMLAVQRILTEMEPGLPVYDVQTLRAQLDDSLWSERVLSILAGVLSGVAILLAAAGIHGMIAYIAAQRTREIGIRVALGARPLSIIVLICGKTYLAVAAGILAGAASVIGAAPRFDQLLYGVTASDPMILTGGVLFMLLVAGSASARAVRSALHLAPAAALRYE